MDPEKAQRTDAASIRSDTTLDEQNNDIPLLVEMAPIPTLASMHEITTTMTRRSQRQQAVKSSDEEGQDKDIKMIPADIYLSEGLSNPGWFVVLGSFLVNFSLFGFTFTWGIFQKLYLEVYAGQTNSFTIAFVGTSAGACMMSLGLFITPVIEKLGYRATMAIGCVMAPLALILASFATQLWQIYLTQGILYGFSATFAFSPAIALPSQWFVKKRAFVTGLAVSGSGIGGVCMSPMAQALITELGYRNALRVMGSMMFALLAIATALARSRWNLKSSPGHKWYELVDTSLLTRDFNLLWLFCLLAPFGYLAPFFLAPTYASYIGASDQQGAAIVSIMSATNAVCRITLGYCGDKFGRINTMFVSTFLSALFSMLVWQFCRSYGPFVAYGLFFGLVSGAFVALTPAIAADIIGVENIQKGIGMLYFATTVGNLLGTPISGLLQQNFGWTATIQYCGAMSLAAALVALILRLSRSWGKKSAWYARY